MTEPRRQAIVDIGSNSIRLVVFGGSPRAPMVLYNEKIVAGLGRGVIETGRLDPECAAVALAGLARFAALTERMELSSLRAVATAAVREAEDGPEFIAKVRDMGLPAEVLDGEGEAMAAGYGVISAFPDADGIVGDMGGGSLELVRVSGGEVQDSASFRLGSLRVAEIRARGTGKLKREVTAAIKTLDWRKQGKGRDLYLVGGSWRSLARVHMHLNKFPLPVIGNYAFSPADARPLYETVRAMDRDKLQAIPQVKKSRAASMDDAAALLASLCDVLEPGRIVVSSFGLREGLLFEGLTPAERRKDPLLEGVRFTTAGQQQVPGYADVLCRWLDPLFADEPDWMARLRYAVCLLGGTGWASNPDFRAIDGEESALHGAWIGVAPRDRAMMAMALYVGLGGNGDEQPILHELADDDLLKTARAWGAAIRLALRLGGGAPAPLASSQIVGNGRELELHMPQSFAPLVDATLEKRLDQLADAAGYKSSRIVFGI